MHGNTCVHCYKRASFLCMMCWNEGDGGQLVPYCSKECQQADWYASHRHFCCLPVPAKRLEPSVYGILLPEEGEGGGEGKVRSRVVEIPTEGQQLSEHSVHSFIDAHPPCISYMTMNPLKGNRQLSDTLVFFYRDNCQVDFKPNECIRKCVTPLPHCWAGPVLVAKYKG